MYKIVKEPLGVLEYFDSYENARDKKKELEKIFGTRKKIELQEVSLDKVINELMTRIEILESENKLLEDTVQYLENKID